MAKKSSPDRRTQILEHAARLFSARGYHATTMDDIADSVRINKGTLYYYYESKANLLFEIVLNTTEKRIAGMRGLGSELDPVDAVRAYIEDTIAYLAEHPVDASINLQEAPFLRHWLSRDQLKMIHSRQAEFEQIAVDAVINGQESGIFDPDLDPRTVAQNLTGIVTWFVRWYKPGGRLSAREVAEQSSRLMLRGLFTPEGIRAVGV